jgi:hypothetical protein
MFALDLGFLGTNLLFENTAYIDTAAVVIKATDATSFIKGAEIAECWDGGDVLEGREGEGCGFWVCVGCIVEVGTVGTGVFGWAGASGGFCIRVGVAGFGLADSGGEVDVGEGVGSGVVTGVGVGAFVGRGVVVGEGGMVAVGIGVGEAVGSGVVIGVGVVEGWGVGWGEGVGKGVGWT